MAGCRRARWQLLGQWGGRRVAGSRISRWGQSVTRSGGKGQLEARGGSKGQMGWGTGGRMVAVRHWGGIPDRGGGYQTGMVRFQTGMVGFQTGMGLKDLP